MDPAATGGELSNVSCNEGGRACRSFGLVWTWPSTSLRFTVSMRRKPWFRNLFRSNEMRQRIGKIEGIGPITATALVAAVGDRTCFKNGRQFAAWLGLVPRQRSSGGKARLFGISKRGDRYLRTLMIHGARAVLGKAGGKRDLRSEWIGRMRERRHPNVVAVALANKNARIVWAVLSGENEYRPVPVASTA